MTAAGAEGFLGIGDWLGQFRAAFRVAAIMPQFGNKLSHAISNKKVPAGPYKSLLVRYFTQRRR
jgi:hypothetical protein